MKSITTFYEFCKAEKEKAIRNKDYKKASRYRDLQRSLEK